MRRLSIAQARRIAVAAQGLADRRPSGRVDRRHLRRVFGRVGLIQIDSVNVLMRSQYVPSFSRLGAYPRELLDDMAYRSRELFEYWGHEASLIPVELHPLFRWRMERARTDAWGRMQRMQRERPGYVESVFGEIAERGPVAASELAEPGTRRGPWWGWADGKATLEWLFWSGRVAVAGRRNFERLYDLPERVLPPGVLEAPTPDPDTAHRELVGLAGRALGVATVADLAEYFRIRSGEARPAVDALVEEGALEPVAVDGWRQRAYLDPGARAPRSVRARALLTPFDSLIWNRDRTERLFGFRYRIEIFVPAPKRVHGYYVLPFLLGDRLVARVDLKAERARGVLAVKGAFGEPGVDARAVAAELAAELRALAGWLGLEEIDVAGRGDLAPALRRAVRSART